MASFSVTLEGLDDPDFKVTALSDAECLGNGTRYRYSYNGVLLSNYTALFNQQSAMMKTDAGTCASLSISLLTTSSRLSDHFLLYTPIELRFRLYQQSNQTSHSDQPKIYPNVFAVRCYA